MKKTLILLRGIPGSGKTTVAEYLASTYENSIWPICCADDFFMVDGEYKFNPTKLGAAHGACKGKCEDMMIEGVERVIVANTNTTAKELAPYYKLAEKYGYTVFTLVVENRHDGVNVHGVPEEALKRMDDKLRASIKLR